MATAADLELSLVGVPLDLSLEELLDLAVPGVPADDDFAFTLFHESDGEDSPRARSFVDDADSSGLDTTKRLTAMMTEVTTRRASDTSSGETVTFVEKIFYMINTCANRLVCWNATGMGFFILDADAFAREVLPVYFKQRNLTTFVSELTLHGFRKTVRRHKTRAIECLEFRHAHFVRGDASQLSLIKRRASTPSSPSSVASFTAALEEAMVSDEEEEDDAEEQGMEGECMGDLKSEISDLKDEVQQTQQLFEKLIGTLMKHNNTSEQTPAQPRMVPMHPFMMCPPHPFAMYGVAPFPPGMHPGFLHPMSFAMGAMAHSMDPRAITTQTADSNTTDIDIDVEDDDFMAEFFPTLE